ncbi:MAG: hypothetical protein K0Q59_6123 [Paenibacillus sp.]|nr:hypothetical protein [Paenibacillus sp.]
MINHRLGIKLRLLSICMVLFVLVAGTPVLHAASGATQQMDAVLAMDASTSMNDSDKNKVANEAMKMFVDMAATKTKWPTKR